MYSSPGHIMAYDGATDTATVQLTGIGALDTWLSGVPVDAGIPRAQCTPGAPCTVLAPDIHRLCEARVIALTDSPTSVVVGQPSGALTVTQTGQQIIPLDASGAATSVNITFHTPFSASPAVTIRPQILRRRPASVSITGITASGFTVAVSGGSPFLTLLFVWSATGPQ